MSNTQKGDTYMAVMTFAAIDIGSYEVSMKIFELSKRIGFRELNDVRCSLELGKGAYAQRAGVSRLRNQCISGTCQSADCYRTDLPQNRAED